jgi:hypothetical protein
MVPQYRSPLLFSAAPQDKMMPRYLSGLIPLPLKLCHDLAHFYRIEQSERCEAVLIGILLEAAHLGHQAGDVLPCLLRPIDVNVL